MGMTDWGYSGPAANRLDGSLDAAAESQNSSRSKIPRALILSDPEFSRSRMGSRGTHKRPATTQQWVSPWFVEVLVPQPCISFGCSSDLLNMS